MANIYFPILNPLKFVDENRATTNQYASKHFDEFLYTEQRNEWEQDVVYCSKWGQNDILKLQFQTDSDPVSIEIKNENGDVVYSNSLNYLLRNKYNSNLFIFETSISLNTFAVGCYKAYITCDNVVLESENFEVIANIDNTVLIEYWNSKFYGNVLFETGIKFGIRVEGLIGVMNPKSKDAMYEDQVLNQTMITSRPYRLFKLSIGGTFGVPLWIIDKLNWAFGCNNVTIDGKFFTKNEGANFEQKEEESYPLRGYNLDVRETLRRDSLVVSTTSNPNNKIVIIGNIEAKAFGDTFNPNQNLIQIVSVE